MAQSLAVSLNLRSGFAGGSVVRARGGHDGAWDRRRSGRVATVACGLQQRRRVCGVQPLVVENNAGGIGESGDAGLDCLKTLGTWRSSHGNRCTSHLKAARSTCAPAEAAFPESAGLAIIAGALLRLAICKVFQYAIVYSYCCGELIIGCEAHLDLPPDKILESYIVSSVVGTALHQFAFNQKNFMSRNCKVWNEVRPYTASTLYGFMKQLHYKEAIAQICLN